MTDLAHGKQFLKAHALEVLKAQLGDLHHYIDQPDVQEIMVNNPGSIWLERAGRYERIDLKVTPAALISAITTLSNINDKGTDILLDCRLPQLRIAATLPPVAVEGPSMSIRRHSARDFSLDYYVHSAAFESTWAPSASDSIIRQRPTDREVIAGGQGLADFIRWAVALRENIAITGSTSSGKTTLLNAAAAEIDPSHRVGVIEDTAELKIKVPNYFRFEANAKLGVDIRSLVRHTLRYRPDRILVGEVRGAEAFDMLDAFNTGHKGGFISFHSDSAELSLARLENMVRMAPEASNWPLADLRRQIASTFRFVLHNSAHGGQRGPDELIEITGVKDGYYEFNRLFRKTNPNPRSNHD